MFQIVTNMLWFIFYNAEREHTYMSTLSSTDLDNRLYYYFFGNTVFCLIFTQLKVHKFTPQTVLGLFFFRIYTRPNKI